MYTDSENTDIASLFISEDIADCCIQPALTRVEYEILDGLVNRIDFEKCEAFDKKCMAWLSTWAHKDICDSTDNFHDLLNGNSAEFHDLIGFCEQQSEEIFLLFYQLANRAKCPYDKLLLYPLHGLASVFPEFGKLWNDVNIALQNEKPNMENRTCNEGTIWHTRKILETRYGYATRLSALFDTRKVLLMTQ